MKIAALAALCLAPSIALAQTSEADREAAIFGTEPEEASNTSTLAPAQSDAERDREAGIFDAPDRESAAAPPSPEGELLEEGLRPAPGFDELEANLGEKDDFLAIGGLVWLRLQYFAIDADDPEEFPLSGSSFADAYLDARPNDRVRGYLRGRLRYDPTVRAGSFDQFGQPQQQVGVQLDQLWLKFDIERVVFVTAGKERVKWGAGRFWNPTDFLNQEALDPLAGVTLFDERLGVGLVKLHLPIESLGWNFYAVATFDGARSIEEAGGALRAEILFAQTELALTVGARKNQPERIGASISSGLGPIDVRGEIALQHGNRGTFVRGRCAPNDFVRRVNEGGLTLGDLSVDGIPELGEAYDRRDDWIPQAVVGVELPIGYGDDDSIYFGAEYFFNDAGYKGEEIYPCLAARGAFTPFYLGKHYAAAYVFLPAPGRWDDTTFVLSSIANLSDSSDVTRLDYRVRVLTYLDINAFVNVHFGEPGTEFRFASAIDPIDVAQLPEQAQGAIEQNPQLAALTRGLVVPAPAFELGVGLSLNF